MAKRKRERVRAKRLRTGRTLTRAELWEQSRSGSHAGRGFRYQDRIATEIALEQLAAGSLRHVIPEGLEDISLETTSRPIHLQAKSRRQKRGDFHASELRGVFAGLARRLLADPDSLLVLVLERPVSDWPRLGEGLRDGHLAVDGSDELFAAQIRPLLQSELTGLDLSVDEFLERLRVEVRDGLPEASLRFLAGQLALPPASCNAHYLAVEAALAELADSNGERAIAEAASFTAADLLQLLERVSEQVDPSALIEPVRDGICELVDFRTAITDERFYDGVDALPGHVVAGLTVERPESTGAVLDAVRERGVALIVGPSGAGKSALLWLTAWESRAEISWYRLQRLRAEDVVKLVRFARGALPTARAPIGFLVDDLGQPQTAGWDELVRELRAVEHVALVGACRQEHLPELATAAATAQIRPGLDEQLATRLYEELRRREATDWRGWREPFEASNGLLLEYGHLLTAGERLSETIRGQIEERRRAGADREGELEVLRLVATADAFGAEIDAGQVQSRLGLTAPALQRALTRLIDEHLLAERGEGRLAGLHALRSRAIEQELHRLPPLSLAATAADVVQLVDPLPLQAFVTQLVATDVPTELMLEALASRITTSPNAAILAAALQALRVAGFATTAAAWAQIMREEQVAPMHADILSSLALLPNTEIDMLDETIQRAVERCRSEPTHDLRPNLLAQLDQATITAVFEAADTEQEASLLAALAGTDTQLPAATIARVVDDEDVDAARDLLDAAYLVSPDDAGRLADELGGSETLLQRLENHLPWVRNAHLDIGADGEVVAAADYAFVAESVQTDPHAQVVELCRYLLALAPHATIARSRALDASGELADFGVPIANKMIPRDNLPSNAAVAWNRVIGRALTRAVAAQSSTDRLTQERELLSQAATVVAEAARAYLTGARVAETVAAALELAEMGIELLPPPEPVELTGPRELGIDNGMNDPPGYLATMIPNNLVVRLLEGDASVGQLIPQLLTQLDILDDPQRWSLLDEKPTQPIARLRRDLNDLHAMLSEARTQGPHALQRLRLIARQGRGSPLRKSAAHARSSADRRLSQQSRRIEQQLATVGLNASVSTRPSELESPYWPQAETLLVVDVASIHEWYVALEKIVHIAEQELTDQPPSFAAPARDGVLFPAFAIHIIGGKVFPAFDDLGDWPELATPRLEEHASLIYRRCTGAITEASAIIASLRPPAEQGATGMLMHDAERDALDSAVARAQAALDEFTDLCRQHPDDNLLGEAHAILTDLGATAEREADARNQGAPQWQGFATEVLAGMRGDPSERFELHLHAAIALSEWDLEPAGALERFTAGIARAEAQSQPRTNPNNPV